MFLFCFAAKVQLLYLPSEKSGDNTLMYFAEPNRTGNVCIDFLFDNDKLLQTTVIQGKIRCTSVG